MAGVQSASGAGTATGYGGEVREEIELSEADQHPPLRAFASDLPNAKLSRSVSKIKPHRNAGAPNASMAWATPPPSAAVSGCGGPMMMGGIGSGADLLVVNPLPVGSAMRVARAQSRS